MGDISQVNESVRLPIDLPVRPYLRDHRFEGKVVLPAVEAMQAIAGAVKGFRPDVDVTSILDARFGKFLYIDEDFSHIAAWIDIAVHENGDITAALLTSSRSKKHAITRVKEHASIRFPRLRPGICKPPFDLTASLEGICLEISSGDVYRDLVPFGPSFHNLRTPLLVSSDGAIARSYAPPAAEKDHDALLGSPFPLDASFHAACVWAQRCAGVVAFPVGIEKRVIFRRTSPGRTYISRVLPVGMEQGVIEFDIWIYDEGGGLCEADCGVHMRDVSAGRMKPPEWVIDADGDHSPERTRSRCLGLSVVELKTVLPFAEKALSDQEKERLQKMGEARRRSYLAARLACKRLYRRLNGDDLDTPASGITTIAPDGFRPCCPLNHGDSSVSCSVSHDDRFSVAVAGHGRVGVDVERISGKALRSRHLYMSEIEQLLTRESELGETAAAVRIWTIKEAVAKAFDMTLAESWHRVRVSAVGARESRVRLDERESVAAVHDEVGRHLFTLIRAEEQPVSGRLCSKDTNGENQ